MLEGNLSLENFKKFCKFLLEHHLSQLAQVDLKRNREVNLPLLQQYASLSEQELFELTKKSLGVFLQNIIEDKAIKVTKQTIEKWKADQLEVSRDSITAQDIVLLYNTRKRSLITFLELYTQNPGEIISIVKELEDFYAFQENLAIQAFAEIKQSQIKENERRLKEAQEIAHMGSWEYNQTTGNAYWSDNLYRIYGLNKEDFPKGVSREDLAKRMSPESVAEFRKKINEIKDKGKKYGIEVTLTRPDGEKRVIWDEGYTERNERGELIIKGISLDITERKKAEEIIREREKFIVHITESNPDTIYVFDLQEKKYLYLNKKIEESFGYDDDFLEKSGDEAIKAVVHPEDLQILYGRYQKYEKLSDHQILEDEIRILDASGNWRWVNTRGMPFKRNEKGIVTQVIGTARDVTKEKSVQLELRATNEELHARYEDLHLIQEELQAANEELAESNLRLEERVAIRTKELSRQREYLMSILMQAPAAIAILKGPELTFELTSPLYNELVGKHDLLGKKGRQALPELASQGIWDILENVYRTGTTFQAQEFPVVFKNNNEEEGRMAYFNFVAIPLRLPDGSIDGVMIHAIEVTKQVVAANESKENAEKFRLVLESIPPMAWTATSDGIVNYYSQRWYDYTGQTIEEALNNGWENVLHPGDVEQAWAAWKHSLETGTPVEMENQFRRASDGVYEWHLVKGVPLKNADGQILMWVGTCTNIHELKAATRILKENEAQLRLITNNIPAYVSYVDKNQRYVFANYYYNNLGFVQGNIEGKTIQEVLLDNYRQSLPNIQKVLNGELVTFETSIDLKDGTKKQLEVKYVPNKDGEGNVLGFVVLGVDLTERIEIEKTLEQKNADLMRINSDLDTFVYTASHDLKAPVSNIEGLMSGLVEAITQQNKLDDEVKLLIDMIHTSIDKFKNTIQNLTEVSKIQNNIPDDIKEVNLLEVIENVRILIEDHIKQSGARINIHAQKGCTLQYSESNLQSIVFNLLSNAIKYKAPDRKPIIDISFFDREEEVCLEVKDNGLGIAPQHFNTIFKMFKRAHHHVEGTGVGLYLVKRIVDNAQGRIEVESEVDKGTTFRIFFKRNEKQ